MGSEMGKYSCKNNNLVVVTSFCPKYSDVVFYVLHGD